MPAIRNGGVSLIPTTAVATSQTSTAQEALLWDHLYLFVAFTKGSLTSYAVKPQFSLDLSTWWDVYDATQTLINYSMTADFNGAFILGSNNTNSRMQPLAICVPGFRIVGTATGTATSSSIAVDGFAFTLGGGQD